jgi:signal transduction histidine kinase
MTEDELKAELQRSRAEADALREELEETNRGVVALYGELDMQAEKLRKATELKSRFLSYMSHEFRTPIGAIRSNARLLLDRGRPADDGADPAGGVHPGNGRRILGDGQ